MIPARLIICLLLLFTTAAPAHTNQQEILASVDFEQRIGNALPETVRFRDAAGASRQLASLAEEKPLLLVMSWFDCPNLCPMLLDQLATATGGLDLSSNNFNVAIVSIAPAEKPATARRTRKRLARTHDRNMANWHFLTGDKENIDALAQAVGFQYTYDSKRERYAHPAGITVVSPGGHINRYLFGLNPETRDIRLALIEAGRGNLGDAVDHALLRCYRYNPQTGRYDLAVMNLLRVAGGGSVIMLAGLVFWLRRRERQ